MVSKATRAGSSTTSDPKQLEVKVDGKTSAKPAKHDPLKLKQAYRDSMYSRPVRQVVIKDAQPTDVSAVDYFLNALGVPIRLELPPIMPKKDAPLADFGISISVRLLLQYQFEAAIVFLLMFLLSLAPMTDNIDRAYVRERCRSMASSHGDPTPYSAGLGYHFLTQQPSEYAAFGINETFAAAMTAELGFAASDCGYYGTTMWDVGEGGGARREEDSPVRRFHKLSLDVYQPSDYFMLQTSLGGCQEFNNHTLSGPNEHDETLLSFNSRPALTNTPNAKFCFGASNLSLVSAWFSYLSLLLFLGFLVRLRWLAQRAGLEEDHSRITTADYAVRFGGLTTKLPADELRDRLLADLEGLDGGRFKGRIDHVTVGRHCQAEIAVMQRMARLDISCEEVEARRAIKIANEQPTDNEDTALTGLARKYLTAKNRMKELIDQPDIATGHAFVVFQYEVDRNACVNLFYRRRSTLFDVWSAWVSAKAETMTRTKSMQRTKKEGGATLSVVAAPDEARAPTTIVKVMRWFKVKTYLELMESMLLSESKKDALEVSSAPEPDEILWHNLEADDNHEATVEAWGYSLTLLLILTGIVVIVSMKLWQINVKLEVGRDPSTTTVRALTLTLVMTAAVSAVTVTWNFLLRILATKVTKREGQDTETDEERSLFSKLSLAYMFNAVIVPIVLGIVLSAGPHRQAMDQTWYESGGVVSQSLFLIIMNCSNDIMKVFNPALLQRVGLARFAYSQSKLTRLYEPPKMRIGVQYAFAMKTTALGLIYGPLFPPAYALTSFFLAFSLFCTRFSLKHWVRRPAAVDQEMLLEFRQHLGFAVFLSIVVQALAIYNSAASDLRDFNSTGVLIVGAPVAWLLYALVPLGALRWFARHDQIGFREALGREAHLDTKGLAFGDVTQKTGQDVLNYECPVLRAADLVEPSPMAKYDKGLAKGSFRTQSRERRTVGAAAAGGPCRGSRQLSRKVSQGELDLAIAIQASAAEPLRQASGLLYAPEEVLTRAKSSHESRRASFSEAV